MLAFTATVKVVAETSEERVINGYTYNVYSVQAGHTVIYGLFDKRADVTVGSCITSDDVYLTNYDMGKSPVQLALRFGKFHEVEESQVPDALEVKCNGRYYKPRKDEVRFAGVARRPFFPSTLSIKNEVGNNFNVLLVGIYRQAYALKELPDKCYINCTAKIYPRAYGPGYELNVRDFTVCD